MLESITWNEVVASKVYREHKSPRILLSLASERLVTDPVQDSLLFHKTKLAQRSFHLPTDESWQALLRIQRRLTRLRMASQQM